MVGENYSEIFEKNFKGVGKTGPENTVNAQLKQ